MKKIKILFWILTSSLILSFFLLVLLGKKTNKILYNYLNVETERFTSSIVNSVVNDIVAKNLEEKLFIIIKNEKDEVEMIDYNTKEVNKILSKITQEIQKRLMKLEDGDLNGLKIVDSFKLKNNKNGVICKVPMGSLRGNTLLVNLGPIIPIRLLFIGQVQSNINTKITSYGINNLVLQINVEVEVEQYITMPVMTKKKTLKIKAPLTIKIIQGTIPNYYLAGIEKNSNSIATPVE